MQKTRGVRIRATGVAVRSMASALVESLGAFDTNGDVGKLDLALRPVVHVLVDFTQATVTGDPFLTGTAALHF